MRAAVQRDRAVVERDGHADADDGDVHLVARDEAQVRGCRSAAAAAAGAGATQELAAAQDGAARAGAELLDRHLARALAARR